jgi:CRP/FNR family transcriptional regulator, cyclic AMP receptor protein
MMINPLISLCENNPDFAKFTQSKQVIIKKNTRIIRKNTKVSYLYLIVSGQVRIGAKEKNDSIKPAFCILNEGEIFGELSLYSDLPASAEVSTLSNVTLIRLNKAKIQDYFDANPDEGYQFLKFMFILLANRLRNANSKIIDIFTWGLGTQE